MNNVKKVIPIIILFISGCANHNVFAPFLIPSPIGGSNGKVLLYGGTPEQKYYKFPTLTGKDYLFISDWNGAAISPLVPSGMIENYRVEDISPNKSLLLLSTDVMGYSDENPFGLTDLYAIDVSQPNKKPLFLDRGGYFHAGAKWIDDHQVLFAGNDNHIISLYIINIDNLQKTLIFKPEVKQNIYRILYVNKKRIYWLDYFDKIWTANIDGTSSYILNIEQWVRGDNGSAIEDRCEVSPDGKWLAWQMDNWKGLQTISTVFFLYSLVDGSIVDIKEISQPRPEYPYTLLFSESNLVITPNSVNDYNGLYFKKIPIYVYNLSTKASSEVDVNYSDYEVMEGYDSYSLSSDGHLLIINSDIHITNNKTKLPSYIDVKIINLDNGKVYNFMVSDFRHVIWIK